MFTHIKPAPQIHLHTPPHATPANGPLPRKTERRQERNQSRLEDTY